MAPFAPLLLLVLWIGIAPSPLMQKVQGVASAVSGLAAAPASADRALAATGSSHAR
jgi:hypothetical protein